MKKITLLSVVALVLLLCFTACGSGSDEESLSVEFEHTLSLNKGTFATLSINANRELDPQLLKWRIDNEDIAQITKNDLSLEIKGVISGTATISLFYDGKTIGECSLTVNQPKLYVQLPQNRIVLTAGKTVTVTAVCSTEGQVKWQSSDEAAVSVESQNLIGRITVSETAAEGTYYITVSVDDLSCKFEVVVIGK